MADRLHGAFSDAGLPAPTLSLRTFIGAGDSAEVWLRAVVDIIETLVPTMEAQGAATAREVGVDTLAQRLMDEVRKSRSTLIGRSEAGAWCRVGQSS